MSATCGDPHDFKNVLAGIVGCVDLAMNTLQADHPARRYLDAIKRTALDASQHVDARDLALDGHDSGPLLVDAPSGSVALRPGTALVVEDESLVRMCVRHYLERRGYEVLVARDATEGTALVNSTDQPLDLLVVDMVLRDGESGFAVATAARRARPALGIVCMSALTPQALVRSGHITPGTRILQKPFAEDQLVDAIRLARDAPLAAP